MRLSLGVQAVFASCAVAVKIKLSRTVVPWNDPPSTSLLPRQVGMGLSNVYDVLYMANVTIGDAVYPVQLDTGSSDLWVRPSGNSLAGSSATSLTYNISYSVGYAAGNIVTAPVTFAGTSVASQALLDVTSSNNAIFQYGAEGVLGLGFSSLSKITGAISASGGTTNGNAYLANVFAQNTSDPNFIAFGLGRTNGLSTDVTSTFSIGEVDPAYAGIAQTQEISTWPVSQPSRWTLLVDGYEYADGVKRNMSTTVPGAPGAVLLADTGASYAYAPPDVVTGLYGGITGASFSSATNTWSLPCDQEVNFALWIGGRKFAWHPLDVVVPSVSSNTTCYGSIMPSTTLNGFDFHGGDVFLRSVYTLLDFGNYTTGGSTGNPYIRFWSLIDQPTASAEFHKIRGGTAQPYQSSTSASPNAASSQPDVPVNADATGTSASSDQVLIQNMNKLVSYAPIALGVLGLNAVLLLVLCGFALVFLCRRKKGKKARAVSNFTAPALGRPHSYQQVKGDVEDAETPITHKFPIAADLRISTAPSYHEVLSPSEAGVTAVSESFRMNNLEKSGGLTPTKSSSHDRSPSKASVWTTGTATFRPSNLANVTVASPEPSPTKSSSGVGQELLIAANSPSRSLVALPAGASSSSDLHSSHSSHSHHSATQASAPPGPSSRAQEHLAAMEARRAALGGGEPNRRNTVLNSGMEILEPPTWRYQGGSFERRAMSTYVDDGIEREPLQHSAGLRAVPLTDFRNNAEDSQGSFSTGSNPPPDQQAVASGSTRSRDYLAAMEARKGALSGGQDGSMRRNTYHEESEEPLPVPSRRFRGTALQDPGRRANSMYGPEGGNGRETIYFDAADSLLSDGVRSPSSARQGGPGSPRSPSNARTTVNTTSHVEGHSRSGSNTSGPGRSPAASPSPSRTTFPSRNLAPSSLGPSRLPAIGEGNAGPSLAQSQGRPGSYAGHPSSAPPGVRVPSSFGPQGTRPSHGGQTLAQHGEEDLTDQMRRPSFDDRPDVDAFADDRSYAGPPRAPFANPAHRYSAA